MLELCGLIKSVKILSSTSLVAPKAASILNQIANPYYIRTLLQLLIFTTEKVKYLILSIIEDLLKLKVRLEIAEEDTCLIENTQDIFGNSVANFLYTYAKQCAH